MEQCDLLNKFAWNTDTFVIYIEFHNMKWLLVFNFVAYISPTQTTYESYLFQIIRGYTCINLFWNILKYVVWLRITDEGSVPEMRVWLNTANQIWFKIMYTF